MTKMYCQPKPKDTSGVELRLQTGEPVAAYYRQSTSGQVNNIAHAMQTEDLPKLLVERGWSSGDIIIVDTDEGVSGQKAIHEREGMSNLMSLIATGQIGTVAVVDEDRLFRDLTQIESNKFIEACRQAGVHVFTPCSHYVFDHPNHGHLHIKMFRQKSEAAADYIKHHIEERLHPARRRLEANGLWAGASTPTGLMLDLRERLPDGTPNPCHRQYVPYPPHAAVIREYFALYCKNNGNLKRTWEHIEQGGPAVPEIADGDVPHGYRIISQLKRRSKDHGGLVPAYNTLRTMFTNAVYIGHHVHQGQVTHWHHHEAIITEDLFFFAFNKLSKVDLYGNPNPKHVPQNPPGRFEGRERPVERPTYAGLIVSDDVPDAPNRRLGCTYDSNHGSGRYQFVLKQQHPKKPLWRVSAEPVELEIDRLLLERLALTRHDDEVWQNAYDAVGNGQSLALQAVRRQMRDAERERANLAANLSRITDPELVAATERRYCQQGEMLDRLRARETALAAQQVDRSQLKDARHALSQLIEKWSLLTNTHKRQVADCLLTGIKLTRLSRTDKRVELFWVDGETSVGRVHSHRGYQWTKADRERLKAMIEAERTQVEILRAFPDYTWRNIVDQYAYHFNHGKRAGVYTGPRPYNQQTRWADTQAYKSEVGETWTSSKHHSTLVTGDASSPPLSVPMLTDLPALDLS